MWSDTALTLTEFAMLMHIDPFRLAQIDVDGTSNSECNCYFQNSDTHVGRDEIIEAIRFAESTFLDYARFYPAPTAVVRESHTYPRTGRDAYKLFRPKLGYRQLGTPVYTELADAAVSKLDGGEIQAQFTITFAVPDDTTANQIHLYIRSADSGALLPDRAWEIRPLTTVVVDSSGGTGNWQAVVMAPAYLFVKPEMYLTAACLAHESATYVDSVTVYLSELDTCQQAQFVFSCRDCDYAPCDKQYVAACLEEQGNGEVRPRPASCADGTFSAVETTVFPCWPPTDLEISYLSGPTLVKGAMDPYWAKVVFAFALANMDAALNLCDCDIVASSTYEKYREIPKAELSKNISGPNSAQYSLLFDKSDLRRLKGLPPVYGNLFAIGQIRNRTPRAGVGVL